MLRDCGFKDVDLALKTNAFYNYSHRRLMGRAIADPAKSHPGEQQYEHDVYRQDYKSDILYGPGETGLRSLMRRAVRKLNRYFAKRH